MTKIENLPAKLRETGLFCCWRYEEGEGDKKPRKVPYNPRTGGRAQSNNPDTFAPLGWLWPPPAPTMAWVWACSTL